MIQQGLSKEIEQFYFNVERGEFKSQIISPIHKDEDSSDSRSKGRTHWTLILLILEVKETKGSYGNEVLHSKVGNTYNYFLSACILMSAVI